MKNTMAARIAALREMTVADLREKYHEVFGEETRSRHKHFLFMLKNTSRVAYPAFKLIEVVGERIPGIRSLAATVCFAARRRN